MARYEHTSSIDANTLRLLLQDHLTKKKDLDMNIEETIDNGESEVQIAAIGEAVGTGPDGEPVQQNITEESLQKLVERHKDDEILVDCDHESETSSKTEAKGWLSGLKVIPGVGLFGKIKWTDIGKRLIENRVFRYLSPSWWLNESKEPEELTSVALTNKPAIVDNRPIVNSAPVEKEIYIDNEKGILDMTKEELATLVAEIVDTKLAEAKKAEEVEEVKEEIKEEIADNACSEDKVEETKNEEPAEEVKEEVKEEVTEPAEEDKEEKEEVIKIEALNSQPKTAGIDIIKNTAPEKNIADLFKGIKVTRVV